MKKYIKEFIKNKKGEVSIYILTIYILLGFILFSIAFNKIYVIYTNAMRVKETMKEATIYVMTSGWDKVFQSVKEGYSGAYVVGGAELINEEAVYDIMKKELETTKTGVDTYTKYTQNNEIIYTYNNIITEVRNTQYKNVNNRYQIKLSITFIAPLKILFIEQNVKLNLVASATWMPKF